MELEERHNLSVRTYPHTNLSFQGVDTKIGVGVQFADGLTAYDLRNVSRLLIERSEGKCLVEGKENAIKWRRIREKRD